MSVLVSSREYCVHILVFQTSHTRRKREEREREEKVTFICSQAPLIVDDRQRGQNGFERDGDGATS